MFVFACGNIAEGMGILDGRLLAGPPHYCYNSANSFTSVIHGHPHLHGHVVNKREQNRLFSQSYSLALGISSSLASQKL